MNKQSIELINERALITHILNINSQLISSNCKKLLETKLVRLLEINLVKGNNKVKDLNNL